MKRFCSATIIYIPPGQKEKPGYNLKEGHSIECLELGKENKIKKEKIKRNKEEYINLCENVMNTSTIYNREMFKERFKEIYNDPSNKYDFEINNSMLNNIISKWKSTSAKFNKSGVLINKYDYQKRLIFREFRSLYVHVPNKKNLFYWNT